MKFSNKCPFELEMQTPRQSQIEDDKKEDEEHVDQVFVIIE